MDKIEQYLTKGIRIFFKLIVIALLVHMLIMSISTTMVLISVNF